MRVKPRTIVRFSSHDSAIATQPVLLSGLCVVMSSPEESVAIRLLDGSVAWRTKDDVHFPLGLAGNTFILTTGRSVEGVSVDGRRLWTLDVVLGRWTRWRDRLIMAGSPVRVVDATTAQLVRTIQLPFEVEYGVAGGTNYFSSSQDLNRFACTDLDSDALVWERDLFATTDGLAQARPPETFAFSVSEGDVFLARLSGHVTGFSSHTGAALWRRPLTSRFPPTLVGNDAIVWYAIETDAGITTSNRLLCLRADSGEVRYDRDLSEFGEAFAGHHDASLPEIGPSTVVVSTRQGLLAAFERETGTLRWWYQHKDHLSPPTLDGDSVLVSTEDGKLLTFDL